MCTIILKSFFYDWLEEVTDWLAIEGKIINHKLSLQKKICVTLTWLQQLFYVLTVS
jgi:hypothetical protein